MILSPPDNSQDPSDNTQTPPRHHRHPPPHPFHRQTVLGDKVAAEQYNTELILPYLFLFYHPLTIHRILQTKPRHHPETTDTPLPQTLGQTVSIVRHWETRRQLESATLTDLSPFLLRLSPPDNKQDPSDITQNPDALQIPPTSPANTPRHLR